MFQATNKIINSLNQKYDRNIKNNEWYKMQFLIN